MQVVQNTAGYPDVTNTHKEKLEDSYGLAWGKAISDDWFGGGTHTNITNSNSSFFRQRFDKIQENRAYSAGLQRPEIYQQWLNETGDESYLAIDWRNMSVIPKFVKLITDFIMDLPESINIQAVDEISLTSKEEYKKELIEKMFAKDLIEEAREVFGDSFSVDEFIPESMEEVDMHLNLNFKQSVEVAMEQVVNLVFKLNKYPNDIKRQIIQDTVENSLAAVRVYADPQEGIQIRWVDIAYLIHSPSKYPDFRDGFYAGEVVPTSIYELKRLAGNKWDESKWKEIAEKQSGRSFTGTGGDSLSNRNPHVAGYTNDYDKAFLDVLHFEIKVPNKKKYEKKESRYGNEDFFEKEDDYTPPEKSKYKRELVEYEYETCYSGKYILGTDMILDWSQSENVPMTERDPQKASLSYKIHISDGYKGQSRSYVDSMKPAADQMMLAWLKIQQMVSQAKPTSVAIAVDSINNLNMGGGEFISYGEAIDIYEATGRLYHKVRNEEGDWISGGSPITPLPNDIRNLNELMGVYNFSLEQIRNITGITREMEGIIGNRQAAKTVESSINSSSSAISDVAYTYTSITEEAANTVTSLVKDIPNDHKIYKFYKDAIGASDMSVVDALGDRSLHSFGITITVETDLVKRIQLNQDIQISLSQKEIKLEDAMEVREVADQGNLNMAKRLLAHRRAKREKEEQTRQQQAQIIQMQMNVASVQAKAQADQQAMMMELETYKQKKAIDLKEFAMKKNIEHGMNKEMSMQDYMEALNIEKLKAGVGDMKSEKELMRSFAKQRNQGEIQKELNIQRAELGKKQNPSVTDMM